MMVKWNMEPKTVKELNKITKDCGIRGYSKMRKAELVSKLMYPLFGNEFGGPPQPPPTNQGNLKDEPIHEVFAPVLEPTPYVFRRKSKKKFDSRLKRKLDRFANWILPYKPKITKRAVNERVELLKKEICETYEKTKQSGVQTEGEERGAEERELFPEGTTFIKMG